MEDTQKPTRGLFPKLDGTPAHVLIIAGLTLALFAPLIPAFKQAAVASARVEAEQADALIELDLAALRRDHEKERAEDQRQQRTELTGFSGSLSPEEITRRQQESAAKQEARQRREDDRKKAVEQKQEDLRKTYDTVVLRRALLGAQAAAAGMRWHLVLAWLGRVALMLGLLVLTLQSEGVRQKILLVVLLVVMISSLAGLNLDFQAHGTLGDTFRDVPAQRR